jgi:hypothetical protein
MFHSYVKLPEGNMFFLYGGNNLGDAFAIGGLT